MDSNPTQMGHGDGHIGQANADVILGEIMKINQQFSSLKDEVNHLRKRFDETDTRSVASDVSEINSLENEPSDRHNRNKVDRNRPSDRTGYQYSPSLNGDFQGNHNSHTGYGNKTDASRYNPVNPEIRQASYIDHTRSYTGNTNVHSGYYDGRVVDMYEQPSPYLRQGNFSNDQQNDQPRQLNPRQSRQDTNAPNRSFSHPRSFRQNEDTHVRVKNFVAKDTDWLDYRMYFSKIANKAHWSDEMKCVKLLGAIDSSLLGSTNELSDDFTFDELLDKLDHVNGFEFARREAENKLSTIKRKDSETIDIISFCVSL